MSDARETAVTPRPAATVVILSSTVVESRNPADTAEQPTPERLGAEALGVYRRLLRRSRLLAFVPAWLAVNAILAALLGLIQFLLSLPLARKNREQRKQGRITPLILQTIHQACRGC